MKLMVSSYNNGGTAWNAEAEETELLSYSIIHAFNKPAECNIVLADPSGTLMQKYNADANDVYLGVGKITLEDPTGTDIFYGRIIKAQGDSDARTLTLVCRDWLDQLDEEHITYDMREKLSGNIRQSVIKSDYDDTDGNGIGPANNVAGTFYVYDHDIGLTANAHNGMKMFLTAGMAGSNSWHTGPYTETVTPSAAPMLVDLFVGAGADDISYLWEEDDEYHSLSDTADWVVDYSFKNWVPDSDFFVSCSGARVHIQYEHAGDSFDISMELYNGATYDSIGRVIGDALGNRFEKTIEIPANLLSGMFDANGEVKVRLNCAEATGGTINIFYIHVEIDTITDGYATPISITDGETYRLTVGTDLSADATKVWDGLPYCVAQEIYKHIDSAETPGLLIDTSGDATGDPIVPLTCAATIEHTTGYSTRQYKERTRLKILQDLAQEDLAVFWITLGGSTVTWKKTFGADTMQLTDGKVLNWQSLQDYNTMRNEFHIYGANLGDAEVYQNVENAASQLKFLATKSEVIKSAGIVSDAHAKEIGTALAARQNDIPQMVSCVIAGNTITAAHATTIKLGEIVEITSSYLWPAAAAKDYIVSRIAYDSVENKTYLTMYPKVSTGQPVIDTPHSKESDRERVINDTETDKYVSTTVTNEVA